MVKVSRLPWVRYSDSHDPTKGSLPPLVPPLPGATTVPPLPGTLLPPEPGRPLPPAPGALLPPSPDPLEDPPQPRLPITRTNTNVRRQVGFMRDQREQRSCLHLR